MEELEQALYSTIEAALGAGASGVFQDVAPEGQAFPFVVFQLVAAPDTYTFKARVKTEYVYQVSVWDQGNDKTRANQLAAEIEAALNDQPLAVSGHMQTRRDDAFSFSQRDAGLAYVQVGGNYRITVGS